MDALNIKIDALNVILQQLENAFQRHEKEVVIELAIDRILHYMGVYLVLVLVVLAKVSQIIDENLVCYPTNATSVDRAFMIYSTNYCWESFVMSDGNGSHDRPEMLKRQELMVHNAATVLSFTQWMPYFFLGEVVLFSIPSLWWHIAVGARLTGHLQFMLSFLKDVYESLHKIPAGIYRKKPYDAEGRYLDGWRRFNKEYKSKEIQGMDSGTNNGYTEPTRSGAPEIWEVQLRKLEFRKVLKAIVDSDTKEEDGGHASTESNSEESQKVNILTGNLKDRHLFSMLCYENFASLEYHPYIMSVYGLTSTAAAEGDRRGIVPLKQGILRQFCHEKNFTGHFIAKCYVIRYLMCIVFSSVVLSTCLILFGSVMKQTFTTKTFVCDIPLHNQQMVCTMMGHWDVMALFIVNICILLVYLLMSVSQFCFVRFGSHRALCYYFEDMNDNFSVAISSAHVAEMNQ